MEFLLNATEYYATNSVLSVESIKLMTIIEAKMGQNGKRSKYATLYYIFLGYRDSNQIMVYIVGNLLIKSHFKIRIQAL